MSNRFTDKEDAKATSELANRIRAEELELLFHQSFPAIYVSFFTALVLTAILWPVKDHAVLMAWFSTLTVTALGRYALFLRFRRVSPKRVDILAWEKPYFVTLMLTTLTWGIGSLVIMPVDSLVHQVVILSFMIGLSGGAISLYSAHRVMTLATVVSLLAPVTGWFLVTGGQLAIQLAIGAGVFFVSAIRATKIIASSQHRNFLLTHELRESKKRYQRLVEGIGDRFVIYSHEAVSGQLEYVSSGFRKIFGVPKEQALGKRWDGLVEWKPGEADRAEGRIPKFASGEIDFIQFDRAFFHPDGSQRVVRISEHPVKEKSGEVVALEGIAEDITEKRRIEEQLRLAATVFDHSQDGVLIAGADGTIVDANPACCEITGYRKDEIIGNKPSMFSSGKHPEAFYRELWRELNASGHWKGESWNRRKNGEVYAQRISIDAVVDNNGELQHYVAVFHDISYLKEHEAELRQMAYYDILTGLPNRLLLQDRMKLALHQARRNRKVTAVCYLDLDGFKPVNDKYGHNAGDRLLVEVAGRIKHSIRSGDTVARVGGDEFVVLLTDYSDETELHEILERILRAVSKPYSMPFGKVSVSVSIGVACAPDDADSAERLLRRADRSMYVAKSLGPNQYQRYRAE